MHDSFFRQWLELAVHKFRAAPALFNRVEFRVELWEEKCREPTLLAACLECRFDGRKIGLVEQESAATAVDAIVGTLEVLALRVEACLLKKSSFHENYDHT